MGELIPYVVGIEQRLANAVKSIAKNTLGGSLMRLHPKRFDDMLPGTDMIRPAKGEGQHCK